MSFPCKTCRWGPYLFLQPKKILPSFPDLLLMKKAAIIFRQFSAMMLMGIYLFFWSAASLHHFIHHHDHDREICHHAPNEKHIHSEDYAGLDCTLCHIAPGYAEPPVLPTPSLRLPETVLTKPVFGESTILPASPHTQSQPRAPPVRIA